MFCIYDEQLQSKKKHLIKYYYYELNAFSRILEKNEYTE